MTDEWTKKNVRNNRILSSYNEEGIPAIRNYFQKSRQSKKEEQEHYVISPFTSSKKEKEKKKSSDSVGRGHRTRIFKGNLPEEGK